MAGSKQTAPVLAGGLVLAGTAMMIFPMILPSGFIFLGIAFIIVGALTSGLKAVALITAAAVAVHLTFVPLVSGVGSLDPMNLSAYLPNVSIEPPTAAPAEPTVDTAPIAGLTIPTVTAEQSTEPTQPTTEQPEQSPTFTPEPATD